MKKNCNKEKFSRILLVSSFAMRILYQRFNKRICEIVKESPKFTRQCISRHAKLPKSVDSDDVVLDKCHDNPDRPRKFTERDERGLVRAITTVCNTQEGFFTAGRMKNETGLHHVD